MLFGHLGTNTLYIVRFTHFNNKKLLDARVLNFGYFFPVFYYYLM